MSDGAYAYNFFGRLAAQKFEIKRDRELLKRNQEITFADVEGIAEVFEHDEVLAPVRSTPQA